MTGTDDLITRRTVQVLELIDRATTAERELAEAKAEVERLRKALEPFARAAKAMPADDAGPFPLYSLTGYRQITRAELTAASAAITEGGERGQP